MVGFGAGLFVPYTTLYLANEHGLGLSVIGIVQAVGQVSTAMATLVGPALAKRIRRVRAIFLFQMAFQLGWAVMGPISGLIIASHGYSRIFFLSMIFYVGSAVSYFIFFRKLDQRAGMVEVA